MVTDIAGFAAAVYHRGVPVVHVPTTLLGMVDAAIGGKTGVNLPEGKNLVGAFWQPSAVLCDTDVARPRCPPRECRCGLGEMAKYHFLTGDDLAALRPRGARRRVRARSRPTVVAGDERESDGAAGDPQLRPHARPRPRDRRRPTTCATARRWPSASCTPPSWPGGSGASTTTGWPSTGAWSAAYEPADRLPAGGLDADDAGRRSCGRDKKALDGADVRARRARRASRS